MLSRRNLRIKVMQALYAYEQSNDIPPATLIKNLGANINNAYRVLLYQLQCLLEVAAYAETVAEIKHHKYIPSEEDKAFSTKICDNMVYHRIEGSETYKAHIKKEKLHLIPLEENLAKKLFNQLYETQEYKAYASSGSSSKDHAEMLVFLYKKIILPEELFHQHMEEHFMNWYDDDYISVKTLTQLLETAGEDLSRWDINLANIFEELPDEKQFAEDLFLKALEHDEEMVELVSPKLKNWDAERVALVDMILMKMALCELLHFPTIPVKVSINEYIDISKHYSTPKSKDFINGILDNLMKEMREEGRIVKTGRGLKE